MLKTITDNFPHLSATVKHVADVTAGTVGVTLPIAFWLDKLVNPAITALVGIATLIWLIYRIKEIRRNLNKDD